MVMDVRAVNEFVAAGNHLGNGTETGANFNYDYIECVVAPSPHWIIFNKILFY